MREALTLDELADLTHILVRRLRYVLDQGLLPGGKIASRGRGAARSFTPFECFGIAVAALMLEAGLKRALVRDGLAVLCREAPDRDVDKVPLYRAFSVDQAAWLEVGDWRHVRLSGAGRLSREKGFDTGWLPLDGGTDSVASYEPLIVVRINVFQIRRKLRRW